jgi:hypothetical protein
VIEAEDSDAHNTLDSAIVDFVRSFSRGLKNRAKHNAPKGALLRKEAVSDIAFLAVFQTAAKRLTGDNRSMDCNGLFDSNRTRGYVQVNDSVAMN